MNDETPDELTELLKEVRRIEVQSKRLVNDVMAGGYSSAFRGAGIEFDEVREYVDGDDLRSVDANVTARTGRPHIKKYVDERELTVLFLVDLSASMSGGFGVWSARQMAARLCACLGLSAVQNNDKVGLIAFTGDVDKYVPARKGSDHVLSIVRDCLALAGDGAQADLRPPLELARHSFRRHAVVFLMSDFMADGWRRTLEVCARRHDVVAVRLLVPELDPPPRGLQRLIDPESGCVTVADWSSARVRADYGRRVAAWRARTESELKRARVDLMDVSVPLAPDVRAVARPILKLFRTRDRRGVRA